MLKINYSSKHAKKRMKERGISEKQIRKVIKSPIKTIKQANGKIKVIGKREDGNVIAVVYVKTKFEIIIITSHLI